MMIRAKVLVKYGDNIPTEIILPSFCISSYEPEKMAKEVFRGIDPDFPEKMAAGGILLAGKNFGCSSSREWAPVALKAAGVRLILADFFARIFYRNAISIGLPIMEYAGISKKLEVGDEVEADVLNGILTIVKTNEILKVTPMPQFLLERMEKGGLIPFLKEEVAGKR
jgi:3-isopropylmalate/(R)-2-methylmalate dehydratase small subunit